MATTKKAQATPQGPESTYTLTLPRGEWRAVKLLATLREQTIRELVRAALRQEITKARKSGELPA